MSNNHSIPRLILRVPVEAAEAETADQPVLQQLFEDLAGSIKDTDTVHVYFPAGFLRRQREGQSARFVERALTSHGVAPGQIVLKSLDERNSGVIPMRKVESPERIVIEVNEIAA